MKGGGGMPKHLLCIAGLLSLALVAVGATAAVVTDLFEGTVPVSGQGTAERKKAIKAALAQVVVKVTGDVSAPENPALAPVLENASRWVQQYQYRDNKQGGLFSSSGSRQILWVRFDRSALERQLVDAGLPVWGRNRPATALWIVVEEGGVRSVVGGDARFDIQAAARSAGTTRGIPIVIPLQDLEDQAKVDVAELWGGFTDTVLEASSRYRVQRVLVGRVYQTGLDHWQGQWTLSDGRSMASWTTVGVLPTDVVARAVEGTADRLAARYAPLFAGGERQVYLAVNGIGDLERYARVSAYLASLDSVSHVQPAQVQGLDVIYRVTVRGRAEGLVELLALDHTLIPRTSAPGNRAGTQLAGALNYQLAP